MLDVGGHTRTCTFAQSSNTYECESSYCASEGKKYASLLDFVEEARVPNRPRLSESYLSSCCGTLITCGSTTQTYTYDAQDRLVRSDGRSLWGYETEPTLSVGNYTEWDGRGRALSGATSSGGKSIEFSIVYDDRARSMTTSYEDGREAFVQQDALGNTIRAGDVTYTVARTEEICL